jgi:hypothetical protein
MFATCNGCDEISWMTRIPRMFARTLKALGVAAAVYSLVLMVIAVKSGIIEF